MGKNYEAYQKALEAQDAARDRMAAANGGSTQQAFTEARTNAVQADAIVREAWDNLMENPDK